MKKLTLIIFLLQISVLFGQNSQSHNCACSDKSKEIKRDWGSFRTFDGFAGVRVRVKGPIDACYNAINNEPNVHTFRWNIEVSGSTNCVFRIDAKSNDGQLHPFGGQIEGECIIPGEIDSRYIARENESRIKSPTILTVHTFSNGETLNISLVKCISSNGNTNNTSQSQTNTHTQQNDLTEYNRSKAEMEQKMNSQNAENVNKRQQYTNAINAGISAHNSGNFAEAKNQFTIAINNSTNETNKQIAQNYYKKTFEKEKNNQNFEKVSELTLQGLEIVQNIVNENKEQKRKKNEIEKEEKINYNDLLDSKLFKAFAYEVIFELKKIGINPDIIGENQLLQPKEDELPSYLTLEVKNKDLSINIHWLYIKNSGEQKSITILCKNEEISKKIMNSKVLDKWSSGKRNQPIYHNYSTKKDGGIWVSEIDHVEFTRKTVTNLNELSNQFDLLRTELKLQQTNEFEKAVKYMGYEIPIKTEQIIDDKISVKTLIENHIIALGGSNNLKKINTVTSFTEDKNGITKQIIGFGKYYQEGMYNKIKFKSVFNGISGYTELNGINKPLNEIAISIKKKIKPISIMELEQSKLKLGKIEKIKGLNYYTLVEQPYKSENLETANTYYFEKNSGLWKCTKMISISPMLSTTTLYIYFEDFKEVNGVLFPFSNVTLDTNKPNSIKKNTIKEIIINESNVNFE